MPILSILNFVAYRVGWGDFQLFENSLGPHRKRETLAKVIFLEF